MSRGYQERTPKEEKLGRIDYSMIIRYPNQMKKWEITFFGPDYRRYEMIKYWATGEVHQIDHGQTDDMVGYLKSLRQA